jgi:hypothetical protein
VARIIVLALIVSIAVGLSAPAADAGKDGACTQLLRFFYVKSADLTETITTHWDFTDGTHKAAVDTTQTGRVSLTNGKLPPSADRKKGHGYADFTELQRQCRIPNYRQGQMYVTEPMTTQLTGTWTAGEKTGTCANAETTDRILRATFMRRSLDWHFPTVGWRWQEPAPTMPACTFTAFGDDEYVTRRLHNVYEFHYPAGRDLTFKKTALLKSKRLTIPIDVKGTTAHSTYELKGTVVLQRYRACSIITLQQLLHGRHCYDPSYP